MNIGAAALGVAGLVLSLVGPGAQAVSGDAAQADSPGVRIERDFQYPDAVHRPTADKPQSKLWYAFGTWWGLLAQKNDGTVHIYRLAERHIWRDTGVVIDDRVGSTADVLWDGEMLYIASRVGGDPLEVSRFSFDEAEETWSRAGAPETVGSGSSASATIAKDSAGRLWVTYTQASAVWVAHTTVADRVWTAPFRPKVPGTSINADDISAVVSFDNRIGVMWSDQDSDRYTFAVHDDNDDDDEWTAEDAGSGFLEVDDHINLQTVATPSETRVLAAVKTSLDEVSGAPAATQQIVVLTRSADGRWTTSPAGSVADGHTRPILAVDESNEQVYLIAASAGLGVFYKRASLDDLTFPDGRGQPLVTSTSMSVGDPTSSKAPVTKDSGLVVLASAPGIARYFHAEVELPSPREDDDVSAPTTPGALVAEPTSGCQVQLVWPRATDDVEVLRYDLQRDGSDLASVTDTSYTDLNVGCGNTVRYTVRAVDSAGNASAPSEVRRVRTPQAPLQRGQGVWMTASSAAANDGGNDLTLPLPTSRSGDVLIASIDAIGSPDIVPPAGWRLVRQDTANSKFLKATYVRVAPDGSAETARWTWNGLGAAAVGNVLAYRGVATTDPVANADGQVNASSTSVAVPQVSVGPDSSAVIGLFAVPGLVAMAPPAEMTGPVSQGNKTGPRQAITGGTAGLLNAEVTTGALSATISKDMPSIGQVLVLRPEDADRG